MLDTKEITVVTASLARLEQIKDDLRKIGITNKDYNIQSDIETIKTDLKLFLLDNGIDTFQH